MKHMEGERCLSEMQFRFRKVGSMADTTRAVVDKKSKKLFSEPGISDRYGTEVYKGDGGSSTMLHTWSYAVERYVQRRVELLREVMVVSFAIDIVLTMSGEMLE